MIKDYGALGEMKICSEHKYSENACFSTILFTTNPTQPGIEPVPPRCEAAVAEVDGSTLPLGGFQNKIKIENWKTTWMT